MYFGYAKTSKTGDILIGVHDTSFSPCSNMGVSEPKVLVLGNGDNAVWGRVDARDILPDEVGDTPLPNPLCMPPLPQSLRDRLYLPCTEEENCENKQRQYEIDRGMYSAYVMCSEKEEKSVLICISQIKDNEPLAKQIFETFQWLPSSHSESVE